jgi:hypothetical protein
VRPLGVGLVFWPELAPLLDDTDLVGVIEIEPQGFWEKLPCGSGACYRPNEGLLRNIAQYPQPKLLHGVGQPVGGVTCDPVDATPSLRGAVEHMPLVFKDGVGYDTAAIFKSMRGQIGMN